MIGGSSELPKAISRMADKIGVITSELPEVITVWQDPDYCRLVYERYETLAAANDIRSQEIRFWKKGKEVSFKKWYRHFRRLRKSVRNRLREEDNWMQNRLRAEDNWMQNRHLFWSRDKGFFSHRIAQLRRSGMSVRVWNFDPEDPKQLEKERVYVQDKEAMQMIRENVWEQNALKELNSFIADGAVDPSPSSGKKGKKRRRSKAQKAAEEVKKYTKKLASNERRESKGESSKSSGKHSKSP